MVNEVGHWLIWAQQIPTSQQILLAQCPPAQALSPSVAGQGEPLNRLSTPTFVLGAITFPVISGWKAPLTVVDVHLPEQEVVSGRAAFSTITSSIRPKNWLELVDDPPACATKTSCVLAARGCAKSTEATNTPLIYSRIVRLSHVAATWVQLVMDAAESSNPSKTVFRTLLSLIVTKGRPLYNPSPN